MRSVNLSALELLLETELENMMDFQKAENSLWAETKERETCSEKG